MRRREFLIGVSAVLSGTAGCGSIMHPQRCGQPHSRDIDWKIVALDGLGLLLFFVPGVCAFVVDFYTGAIYLPPEQPCFPSQPPAMPAPGYPPPYFPSQPSGLVLPPPPDTEAANGPRLPHNAYCSGASLLRVVLPREELSPRRIEEVVSHHTGRPISLADGGARLSRLPRLDHYAEQCQRHRLDAGFGFGIKALLDRWQNV